MTYVAGKKIEMSLDKKQWKTSPLLQQVMIVSSVDTDGNPNIAPKSWVSMVAFKGPVIGFGCNITHHTFHNIQETGNFVINVPPASLAATIWAMTERLGTDRLTASGLTLAPAACVSAPRIVECIGHIECREAGFKQWDDEVYIFGTVEHVAIDPICLTGSADERYRLLDPIFYLEEKTYGTLGGVKTIQD